MVMGRTDHLHGGLAPNWVSPKQGSGPMARHAVTPTTNIRQIRPVAKTAEEPDSDVAERTSRGDFRS
jgi:hypothetical protein